MTIIWNGLWFFFFHSLRLLIRFLFPSFIFSVMEYALLEGYCESEGFHWVCFQFGAKSLLDWLLFIFRMKAPMMRLLLWFSNSHLAVSAVKDCQKFLSDSFFVFFFGNNINLSSVQFRGFTIESSFLLFKSTSRILAITRSWNRSPTFLIPADPRDGKQDWQAFSRQLVQWCWQ